MSLGALAEADLDVDPGPGRRQADQLRAVRRWCIVRAQRKVELAQLIAPLRYADLNHDAVRVRLGLTVGDYRRARRWLTLAVAMCVGAPHGQPLKLADALEQVAERQVRLALAVGDALGRKVGRQRIRDELGITDDEYEIAAEWWRDGTRATAPDDGETAGSPETGGSAQSGQVRERSPGT